MHLYSHEGEKPRLSGGIFQKEEPCVRGNPKLQNPMFFVANTEERLPKDHPLRAIKRQADEVLNEMSRDFEAAYSETGRPSIPPEALLKAMLLQALYAISSERRLVDAINWNLLYRWFCDLDPDALVWDATTFTKNRDRFEAHGLVGKFFERVVQTALVKKHASNDHFTVGGTLIQSWASLKSFRPKNEKRDDGPIEGGSNPSVDFRGEGRSNETHSSTTDPEARLAKKSPGAGAQLSHSGHVLMENRHRLCLDIRGHLPFRVAVGTRHEEGRANLRLAETAGRVAQSAARGPLENPAGGLSLGRGLQPAPHGQPGAARGCGLTSNSNEKRPTRTQNTAHPKEQSFSVAAFVLCAA